MEIEQILLAMTVVKLIKGTTPSVKEVENAYYDAMKTLEHHKHAEWKRKNPGPL